MLIYIHLHAQVHGSVDVALKLPQNRCRLLKRGFLLIIREEEIIEQPSFPPDGDGRLKE